MADDPDATEVINTASDDLENQTITEYAQNTVIGGSLRAIGITLVSMILGIGAAFFRPINAFVEGVTSLITGTFGGPILINEAGATTSAASFESGTASLLGPFAWPAAVLISMLGVFLFIWALSRIDLSPLSVFTGRGD